MYNWLTRVLILTLVSGSIFFVSLGNARLWDRDEPRNAGCALEMMQRGDLIVPIFNDELRHQKPVLLYWLMISAYQCFGVSEFAARFWSALLGCGTVLLTYSIGRRLLGEQVGFVAGIALASSLMFAVAARAATPDSLLIFCSTLGIYFYVRGTFECSSNGAVVPRHSGRWFPQQTSYVLAMNVAFGFAVLAKGPIGIVIPTAIIGMFLLIQRLPEQQAESSKLKSMLVSLLRTINPWHFLKTCWSMRPITAILCAIVVAAPWFIVVGMQTEGSFTNLFFLNENFNRATSVMENHQGGVWFYPLAVAIGFFPWSVLLGPMVLGSIQTMRLDPGRRPAVLLLVCWVLVQIGLFSLAKTKLPSYVTPCYPALALLAAFSLVHWLPEKGASRRFWHFGAFGTLALGGLITSVALAYATVEYLPHVKWIAVIGLVPIVGGACGIWFMFRRQHSPLTIGVIGTTAILFCLLFFGAGTVAIDSERETHVVLNAIKNSDPDRKVATFHCLESSWVYYARRPIYELKRDSDMDVGIQAIDRHRWWDRKPEISPEDFAAQHPNTLFLTTDEYVEDLLTRLPDNYRVVQQSRFFLKSDRQLLLVENSDSELASSPAEKIHRRP